MHYTVFCLFKHKLVSQIAQKMFIRWTHDDLAVRDGYWERRCKGNIFRVYRIWEESSI